HATTETRDRIRHHKRRVAKAHVSCTGDGKVIAGDRFDSEYRFPDRLNLLSLLVPLLAGTTLGGKFGIGVKGLAAQHQGWAADALLGCFFYGRAVQIRAGGKARVFAGSGHGRGAAHRMAQSTNAPEVEPAGKPILGVALVELVKTRKDEHHIVGPIVGSPVP